jgi:hypothetical protein
MASQTYMQNRVKWARPQAMLWSNNPGTLVDGVYLPENAEFDSESGTEEFIILSDHNRTPISVKTLRIENRERMINGRMRSYHIADKLTVTVSWNNLPSRAYNKKPSYDSEGRPSPDSIPNTADGGAGGEELRSWYENNVGSFWVFLSYDSYRNFGTDDSAYTHLAQYSDVIEMYITDFNYSVASRGATNFDLWDVSVTLEEA